MAFKMSFNQDELQGAPPVPSGWYTLQLKGFRPKASKDKESLSLNAEFAIINSVNVDFDNRRVFSGINTKMAFMWPDFIHATGLEMEVVQDADAGTEKQNLTIPGVFENSDTNPDEPEKWKYQGPLLNKTLEVELAEIPAKDGYKAKNEIRQFKCAIQGCTAKHSTNLIRS
jgi:hypothetical protein